MSRIKTWPLMSVAAVTLMGGAAAGQETTTYSYDALGRLTGSGIAGGPNSARQTATCFDSAGNRIRYDVASAAPAACPVVPPTPTPLPTPSFQINNAPAVTEGGGLVFTVSRIGAASATYTVNYGSVSGTATSGSDFTSASGTLTFLPSDTAKTVTIATIDDNAVETTETMSMILSSPSGGAMITTPQGIGTINDNDIPPAFSIGNATAAEGGTLAYTVTKTGSVTGSYTVDYATAAGTALSGTDFTPASGTLTFLSNEATKVINVATIDDSLVESSETVLVNLSAPSDGATIAPSQGTGTGTITDNDTSSNLPPTAVNDTASLQCHSVGTVNLTANDSDPDNNVPLVLQSITVTGGDGNGNATATIISNSSVQISAGDKGQTIFTYVVADSLGASSSAQLTFTATGNVNFCSGGGTNLLQGS